MRLIDLTEIGAKRFFERRVFAEEVSVDLSTQDQNDGEIVQEKDQNHCKADLTSIVAHKLSNVQRKEDNEDLQSNGSDERPTPGFFECHLLVWREKIDEFEQTEGNGC